MPWPALTAERLARIREIATGLHDRKESYTANLLFELLDEIERTKGLQARPPEGEIR